MERWLTHPLFPLVAVFLAVALASPALQLGYVLDDKVHQVMLRSDLPFPDHVDPVWGLFAFMDGTSHRNLTFMDSGMFPWWTDVHLRAQFLRPVTALTHLFDHAMAPENAFFAHVHSLLWLAVCVLLAGILYGRVMGSVAAGLATLMFAVEDAHGMPVAWLANRNALVALAFGLGSIVLHIDGQERNRAWARVLAPVCFLLALLSAEAGVGAAAYLAAYALLMPQPWWRVGALDRWSRVLSLAPYAVVGLAWKVFHSFGGYGASGSGMYVDPIAQPLAFLRAATFRVPVALFAQWSPVPADVAMTVSGSLRFLLGVLAAIVAAASIAWAWRRSGKSPVSAWLLTGSVLAAVPVAAAFPSNRLLVFVGIGVFGAVGLCLSDASQTRGWDRWVAAALVMTHLVLAPVGSLLAASAVQLVGEQWAGQCARAVPSDAPIEDQTLVFVNAHGVCGAYVGPGRALEGATLPRHVRVLASLFTDIEVRRVDSRSLVVRVPAGYQSHPMDRLMRSHERPHPVGTRVELSGFVAAVESHNSSGFVDQVRFTFDRPLEDPSLRFFRMTIGGAQPFVLPSVGQSVRLPRLR